MAPPLSGRGYIIIPEVRAAEQKSRLAEVVIDSPLRELDRPFTYQVPETLETDIQIGSLVLVPFNSRLCLGYVVGFPSDPGRSRLKQISRSLDEPPLFDFDTQRLCRWVASRYLSSLSQAFRLVMPPGRSRKVKQYVSLVGDRDDARRALGGKAGPRADVVEVLAAAGGEVEISDLQKHVGAGVAGPAVRALEDAGLAVRRFALTEPAASPRSRMVVRAGDVPEADLEALPERQRQIMVHLLANTGVELQSDLLRATGTSSASLKSLHRKGLVEISSEEVLRQPWLGDGTTDRTPPSPNLHQQAAIDRICQSIESGVPKVFLLEGITGSGKTEVYLRSIRRVIELGKRAIVLVPEISLTPQTVQRFEARFPGEVAVLHSRLGPGERFDQWRGVREGRFKVVVGARSALFAPVKDLGLIAIDEEHEPSYKSDTAPRYHAREVAEMRARMAGAVLILGSATPSFESLTKARAGTYERLELPVRIDERPLPDVEVVDMRSVGGAGEVPLLSPLLLDALSRTVQSGDQAILFLNRRGFANYMQCRSCGHIMGCDDCEVSLCYHTRGDMLLCHHCGGRRAVPGSCPECGKGPLKSYGAGTQRVEDELLAHIPGVSFIRMDADTTTTRDAHWHLLGAFTRGEAQVLIGTQMIAKGLDVPGVTLVGVINADTALALPDFRAGERTYQLLTQVSGRAGRGLRPGRVVVQSFNPGHPVIAALSGAPGQFVESELRSRLNAGYPPFMELINVTVTAPELADASRSAHRMHSVLETDLAGENARILGPAPAPLSRLRGQYRWHILIKTPEIDRVSERVTASVGRFYDHARASPAGKGVKVSLDADPVSLL